MKKRKCLSFLTFIIILTCGSTNVYSENIDDGIIEESVKSSTSGTDSIMDTTTIDTSSARNEYSCSEIEHKLSRYTSMRNKGAILISAGVPVTILGIALTANSKWETDTIVRNGRTEFETHSDDALFRLVVAVAGVEMFIAGIIITTIGNKKCKEYLELRKHCRFQYDMEMKQIGISLDFQY